MAQRFRSEKDNLQEEASGWLDLSSDCHTVTSRERIRQQLAYDVDAFLAHGGQIQHLEPHMRAENLDDFERGGTF